MSVRQKIIFIYPTGYTHSGALAKSPRAYAPPRVLPYLAALTPSRFDVRLVHEVVDEIDFSADADLIAISGMVYHMPRAIEISRQFRQRGKKTIIGGVAASAMRQELSGHFDSMVLGEADELWPAILDDFEHGRLKSAYECQTPPALDNLPFARYDLIDRSKYFKLSFDKTHPLYTFETSRGCPHDCDYCLVTQFFGKKMRYRPISQVLEEIKASGAKYIVLADDNIAINPTRAKELFGALKTLGIHWFGQFEMSVARHPDVLQAAADSGCTLGLVGIESLIKENLQEVNKHHNLKVDFRQMQQAFDAAGIAVMASMIFGMDHDTPESIEWTVEQLASAGVQLFVPWLLTPAPGTRLYEQYEREQRITCRDWSKYDCMHCVISPKQMDAAQIEDAYWGAMRRFYTVGHILRRAWKAKEHKFNRFLLQLYYRNKVRRGIHPISALS